MHITLPVPEQDPHRSPATITGPLLVWLISGILAPSPAAAPPDAELAVDAAVPGATGIAPSPLQAPHVTYPHPCACTTEFTAGNVPKLWLLEAIMLQSKLMHNEPHFAYH